MTTRITRMDERAEPGFPWLARLLQVTDTAFPTGGYAHSYGFEQMVQFKLVEDRDSMARYLENHLWPMLINFELPVVRFAQEATLKGDFPALIALDACVDATKTARELREASRATGRRRLHAFCETGASPVLEELARAAGEGLCHAHHVVVYGCGLALVPTRALLTSWAFQSLSAVCLAAPKLLRIGQNATQSVLTTALLAMEERIDSSLSIRYEELGWFDPVVEIASMQHEIAYERLFIS